MANKEYPQTFIARQFKYAAEHFTQYLVTVNIKLLMKRKSSLYQWRIGICEHIFSRYHVAQSLTQTDDLGTKSARALAESKF